MIANRMPTRAWPPSTSAGVRSALRTLGASASPDSSRETEGEDDGEDAADDEELRRASPGVVPVAPGSPAPSSSTTRRWAVNTVSVGL